VTTVVGHQFVTLTVDVCIQNGGREAPHHAGLSVIAETFLKALYTVLCALMVLVGDR